MTITGKQIIMARVLLDLSQEQLADKLGITRKTIMRIENGQSPGSAKTLEKIQTFFENNNLEFLEGDGVKRRQSEILTLRGGQGFRTLLDDVYQTTKSIGGEICLHNAKPKNWLTWLGEEWFYDVHAKRMVSIKNKINFKITFQEGDTLQIAQDYAEYRWFPKDMWNEQSFYSYGSKLAFLNFETDQVKIMILDKQEFADGFRNLFNIAWDGVAVRPPKGKGGTS